MSLRSFGALALASVSAVSAFQNTSPFFLFSTSKLADSFDSTYPQLVASTSVTKQIFESLKDCPSSTYIIVEQDGVSSADYSDRRSTPSLSRWLGGEDKSILSAAIIPDVIGNVDIESISAYLFKQCGAASFRIDSAIAILGFSAPSTEDLASNLAAHDSLLNDAVSSIGDDKYTVIYVTTPRSDDQVAIPYQTPQTYEMDDPFPASTHMELKRDVESHEKDTQSEGALFERYMFLSPGIFMGLTASVPLFLILYVGITALSSLEVSYFAFSKEMGPTAQRKQ
ncbi:BIG1-domain-containing protein [Lepidopterella palustris CBS 459.81]|uniref:Protein BIG1 n=1 Tax=Lepidopterella palustris CBS 459.81 TaxID=1314670 RepID=A0A8E2JCK0_9PEZI|nr:BIG1-domain-containing protein [Lepidopterella palustris CBS 459.81]